MRKIEANEWIAEQTREASSSRSVTVRDGHKVPIWMAYRCLYCGEYFNQAGAEYHFGETRMEFNKDAPTEPKIIEVAV